MSLRPPRSEHHWRWFIAFVLIGVGGLSVSGLATYRTSKESATMGRGLQDARKDIQNLPAQIAILVQQRAPVVAQPLSSDRELEAKIETTSLFYTQATAPPPIVSMIVSLVNGGSYPTGARDFQLTVHRPDGSTAKVRSGLVPELLGSVTYSDGTAEKINGNDDLNRKAMQPIPIGGSMTGRLMFQTPDLKIADIPIYFTNFGSKMPTARQS